MQVRRRPWAQATARLALLVLAAAIAACSRERPRARVVASPFAIYDLTRRIAGPDADVAYVGPDAAPDALKDAAVAVVAGGGFDAALEARARGASPKARVVRAADRVPPIGDAEAAKIAPPYVWLDPQRGRLLAKAVAEELARADPGHAGGFRARADALDGELEALDRELEGKVAAWKKGEPAARVPGTYAYFGDRYGVPLAGAPSAAPAAAGPDPFGVESYESTLRAGAARLGAR